MEFMQAYKRLDSLCRDMNGIGITGYIEGMEQAAKGNLYVLRENTDYQRLKYYRYIRNQIAHEVDATEEKICSPEDAIWIEEFYRRILQQTDPLAMYYKSSRLRKNTISSTGKSSKTVTHLSDHISAPPPLKTMTHPSDHIPEPPSPKSTLSNCIVVLIVGIIILTVGVALYCCFF